MCEGETEPIYFKELLYQLTGKKTLPLIDIQSAKAGHTAVTQKAKKLEEKREKQAKRNATKEPYQQIWCVFDTEAPNERNQFNATKNAAIDNNFEIAASNPSFEFWYLLYLSYTTKSFSNAKEVTAFLTNKLQKSCGQTYHKTKMNVLQELYEDKEQVIGHTEEAIKRAQKLLDKRSNLQNKYPNPSTHVHKLVKILLDQYK